MRRRLAASAFWLIAACKPAPDSGAPCETVATRFVHVAQRELGSGSDAVRSAARAQLESVRDHLVAVCIDGKWSAAVRDCMVAADDQTAQLECERRMSDEQRAALDR
jgi:hypothetical protein